MTPIRASSAPRTRSSHLGNEGGFIILGGIILVLVVLVVGVLLGKVFRVQYPDSYIESRAIKHWVVADTELRMGGRSVQRLRPGDAVWATRLENGDVAVSTDSTGQKIVGFVGAYTLSDAPAK